MLILGRGRRRERDEKAEAGYDLAGLGDGNIGGVVGRAEEGEEVRREGSGRGGRGRLVGGFEGKDGWDLGEGRWRR